MNLQDPFQPGYDGDLGDVVIHMGVSFLVYLIIIYGFEFIISILWQLRLWLFSTFYI